MNCETCGTSLPEEAIACWKCGKLLLRATSKTAPTLVAWFRSGVKMVRQLAKFEEVPRQMEFSQDGRLLTIVSDIRNRPLVRGLEIATGQLLYEWFSPLYSPFIAFSARGNIIALGPDDGSIRLAELSTGLELDVLADNKGNALSFSQDGFLLACGHADNSLTIWEVLETHMRWRLQGHSEMVRGVAFSPDNHILASGDSTNTRLWNLETGKAHQVQPDILKNDIAMVPPIVFSPNGDRLIGVSPKWRNSPVLWMLATGVRGSLLSGDSMVSVIGSAAFSPDGQLFVTPGSRELPLWDAKGCRYIRAIAYTENNEVNFTTVVFSPDGSLLATGDSLGFVKLWGLSE